MSTAEPTEPQRPPPSVFLSYASEDRKAAQALRDALETFGLEVWYDESALDGGDAWDQKIRRQIRECDFFMPVISAQTDARPEGYFRREWRLAVERIWLAVVLLARGCSVGRNWDRDESPPATPPAAPRAPAGDTISPADARKLKDIADSYRGSSNTSDVAKLGIEIAQSFASEVGKEVAAAQAPLLAIPFGAPSGDAAAAKLADSTFAQVYGRIAISRHGHVGLVNEPLASPDTAAAVAQGRAREAKYVLYGAVDGLPPAQSLTVKLLSVKDGSVLWSEIYPATGADPAAIAALVEAKMPASKDD